MPNTITVRCRYHGVMNSTSDSLSSVAIAEVELGNERNRGKPNHLSTYDYTLERRGFLVSDTIIIRGKWCAAPFEDPVMA